MGVLPAAALLLLTAQLRGEAVVGASLLQQVGELPTGQADGGSVLSYDTVLQPELRLTLTGTRFEASLAYEPRLLARVQFPDGGATALEVNGRPFLVLHTVAGATTYELAPRFQWNTTVEGLFGEQDFALFAEQGLIPGAGAGAVVPSPVIESTSFTLGSGLRGPLWDRDEFQVVGSFNLTFPAADPLAPGEPAVAAVPGDNLCFGDGGEQPTDEAPGLALTDSCQMGLAFSTLHRLSPLDRLDLEVGYDAIDLDPGPFLNTIFASGLWARTLSRSVRGSLQLGVILGVDADPLEGEDVVSLLPRLDLGLDWTFVDERMLRVALELGIGADGFVDAASRRYLLRTSGEARLSAVIRRDVRLVLGLRAFTLAPDQGCPPRLPGEGIRTGGCPDDLTPDERMSEIPDLSSASVNLDLSWAVDRHLSFVAGARYAFRGPHLSRLGEPAAVAGTPDQSQREVSARVGLRVTYGTTNPP